MKSHHIDVATGLVLALISVSIFIGAQQYVGRGVNTYGPNFFPQALAGLLFISSLVLVVQGARGVTLGELEGIDRAGFIKAAGIFVLALGYLGSMQILGFYLATVAFLYVVMLYLGVRGQVKLLGVSIGVGSVVFSIFHFFLKIPLPEGLL